MSYLYHGGMGALTEMQAFDCANSFWSYMTSPSCWGYTGSDLNAMASLAYPPVPATTAGSAIPAAYQSNPPTDPAVLAQQAADANAAAVAANQAAALAAAQNQGDLPAASCAIGDLACYVKSIPWWGWALGIGAGVLLLRKAN